ncbi:hypothetical protein ACLOJK_004179 [Asimina triloba]
MMLFALERGACRGLPVEGRCSEREKPADAFCSLFFGFLVIKKRRLLRDHLPSSRLFLFPRHKRYAPPHPHRFFSIPSESPHPISQRNEMPLECSSSSSHDRDFPAPDFEPAGRDEEDDIIDLSSDRDSAISAWSSAFHARSSPSTRSSRPSSSAFGSPGSPLLAPLKESPLRACSSLSASSSSYSSPSPPFFSFRDLGYLVGVCWASVGNAVGGLQRRPRPVVVAGKRKGAARFWHRRTRVKGIVAVLGLLVASLFLLNWWMLSYLQNPDFLNGDATLFVLDLSSSQIRRIDWLDRPEHQWGVN